MIRPGVDGIAIRGNRGSPFMTEAARVPAPLGGGGQALVGDPPGSPIRSQIACAVAGTRRGEDRHDAQRLEGVAHHRVDRRARSVFHGSFASR